MKLADLEYAPEFTLPNGVVLHRVQRARARPGCVAIGSLRLPPTGLLKGRFDLPDEDVGHFAEDQVTAVLEAVARREVVAVSVDGLSRLAFIAVRSTRLLRLLDLRPLAAALPVLQSLRYSETQELASNARAQGFEGILFRSAQHYGSDCFAIFGAALASLRPVSKELLVQARTGALHRSVSAAVQGSRILLVP